MERALAGVGQPPSTSEVQRRMARVVLGWGRSRLLHARCNLTGRASANDSLAISVGTALRLALTRGLDVPPLARRAVGPGKALEFRMQAHAPIPLLAVRMSLQRGRPP